MVFSSWPGYNFSEFGAGGVNDGEELWRKLVKPNLDIRFVFSGHKTTPDYFGHLISVNDFGFEVSQSFFNTQDFKRGGDGWIQILEFKKDKKTTCLHAYSPILKEWHTDFLENKYIFEYR